jgi:hypothetical protein
MSPSRQRIIAAVVFVVGLVFLATAGVDLIVNGQSRSATGTFFGVLLVSVAVHRWLVARRQTRWSPPTRRDRVEVDRLARA